MSFVLFGVEKRNLSKSRGLKGSWKDIRTLEWNWKRDVTPVPSEMVRSLAQEEGANPYHLDLEQLTIESSFFHYFRIHNSAKGKPGYKLFKNSGVVEFLDPLP
ncbi:hypothetical protein COLO4_03267 [Corchorus olitorius]|uniref:Uncharacterized protein n=1 Tax=Corchorus olitorius TaxID=93759 RepID=A0A1R3KZ66_9ROSI|nr:hypothetical protein COLO4_03267 [Corchorus olitorius]